MTSPIAIFLVVLLIALLTPMLLRRLRIPHMVGMILAGMLVGPHVLNLIPFDRSIDVFGKVGLYYIMFLAGMEIDISSLRSNMGKGVTFGLLSFLFPALLGYVSSRFLLHYGVATSLLVASMFASHTLMAFPTVSRYGLGHRPVVSIAVGGTVLTVTLAILMLAGVECSFKDQDLNGLWLGMALKMLAALVLVFYAMPQLSRWFLRHYKDGVLQFVFVLAMAFASALLTEIAGFQGVLGAFFAGLALNQQVPKLSSLMNRVEFVGNALFFPYFLVSIGMMADLSAFAQSWEGWKVALIMTVAVLLGKMLAARSTQWLYGMRPSEGRLLFGLSSGRAAVTLAVVMIGFNIILGYNDAGQPIRLINEYVFNGSIVMILVCCLVSSMATERGARQMLLEGDHERQTGQEAANLLVPVSNPKAIGDLVQQAVYMRSPQDGLYMLSVVEDNRDMDRRQCSSLLDMAAQFAAATGVESHQVMRFDTDVAAGIRHAAREYHSAEVLMGIPAQMSWQRHVDRLAFMVEHVRLNLFITRFQQAPGQLRRMMVILPEKAEYEQGFYPLMKRLYWMCRNMNAVPQIYAHPATLQQIRQMKRKYSVETDLVLNELHNWDHISLLAGNADADCLVVLALSRQGGVSYQPLFDSFPQEVEDVFPRRNIMLFYPEQPRFEQKITTYSGPLDVSKTQ